MTHSRKEDERAFRKDKVWPPSTWLAALGLMIVHAQSRKRPTCRGVSTKNLLKPSRLFSGLLWMFAS